MADSSKVSTPEEVAEAMEAYRRQTGHYPPAVMLHPETMGAIKGALAAATIASVYGGVDLLARPYIPLGLLLFCERDGSIPDAKPSLLSMGYAELFIEDANGVKKSLGTVTDFHMKLPAPDFVVSPLSIVDHPAYVDRADIERYLIGESPIVISSPDELREGLADEFGL